MSSPTPVNTYPVDPTRLSSGKYTSTIIINRLISSLSDMTSLLQTAAAAQSNRLTIMSKYQEAYTNVMNQIHVFTPGSTGPLSSTTAQDQIDQRTALNTYNQTLTQNLQNRQSVISDDAKALQSIVNRSTDAATQQATLGTSLLSQISTLLSSLFQG